VYFKPGTLSNIDSDANAEFVIVEFNALATNEIANQNNDSLTNAFTARGYVGGSMQALNSGASNTVTLTIGEPSITDLSKTASTVSSPPDAGDTVTGYQIQIASDETFTNVLTAAAVAAQPAVLLVQMSALPGYEALALNARYYWRVRALDLWEAPSAWTSASFVYGELQTEPPAPAEPVTITGMTVVDGQVLLSWTASAYPVRVEFTASLTDPQWVPVNGATGLGGTAVAVPFPTGEPQGFFRVVVEGEAQ